MKLTHFSVSALCLLVGITLSVQPIYAEPEEKATEEKAEEADGPEEGSKEWKRAKSIACQKQAATEYKSMRQLANMLKKAKNEKDYKKINKLADDIVKKCSALYTGGSIKVNDMEITVDDMKPAHTKLGSQRKKLYKDYLEFCENQRSRQDNSAWGDIGKEKDKNKNKKKEKETVSLNMGTLDQIKDFMRANQEDFAAKLDSELEGPMDKDAR